MGGYRLRGGRPGPLPEPGFGPRFLGVLCCGYYYY